MPWVGAPVVATDAGRVELCEESRSYRLGRIVEVCQSSLAVWVRLGV